jgi:bifunctional DNA-binding transcriptional regulator/antitoxin component of YhaV-PrlF toxin-antitoxin module
LPIGIPNGNFLGMEKMISIDEVGRTVLPKAIREAASLGKGGPAKVRLAPGGIIEIEAIAPERRRLKKVGKFLVAATDGKAVYDAAADVRSERDSR